MYICIYKNMFTDRELGVVEGNGLERGQVGNLVQDVLLYIYV